MKRLCFFQTYRDSDKCNLNHDLFHIIIFFVDLLAVLSNCISNKFSDYKSITFRNLCFSLTKKCKIKTPNPNIITVDITFPNVHFILNKSTKTNIRYLQYLHGNVHFLWSFFQLDASNKAGSTQRLGGLKLSHAESIFNHDAEQLTDDSISDLITFFVKSASHLSRI